MSELTIYDSTDFQEVDDIEDIKSFYRLLYKLNEATLTMSKATSMSELYRLAIVTATTLLEIDRIGILLIDDAQEFINGTWGIDEEGQLCNEYDQKSPVDNEVRDVIRLLDNQEKVCIWDKQPLYEFNKSGDISTVVGFGWNGAIALWEHDKLIGWIACDNLTYHRPFKTYQSHILRLFGSTISEYRLRFLAQEKIENLNKTLESKVIQRTEELVAAQKALQEVNQDLESKVKQRTLSLEAKNVQLAHTIEQLKETQTELQHAQAYGAMNDLVVGVAHEVNTPLGCAITASSYLPHVFNEMQSALNNQQTEKFPQLVENAKDAAHLLHGNLESTASLISEFKRLSMLDVEAIPAKKVGLEDWLNNILLSVRTYEVDIKKLNIHTKIETNVDDVIIQSDIFVQIFQELLLNAYLHNPQRDKNKILIKLSIEEQQLLIYIEDNGSGIDKQMQQRIFNPFVTTLRTQGRRGLGLNVAFNLIHFLLKGSLTYFDSQQGGAGFLIRCPIQLAEES
ncbi:hypothetical protein CW745_09965 [Psychromonas sp. psych-6C06]|uniref:sensor histidine kinase n=1 Tax=Psychromonas sp. psych-6C06 TaxID=2058089 RepID=UPI000C3438EC|nr:HAMP domain-containing sensor histidine kinase [Psychromonas sp. psych-6C06]PKF61641.1 hypothetical protein CW745_09965 [Psychromonas sp. psych-6C06]